MHFTLLPLALLLSAAIQSIAKPIPRHTHSLGRAHNFALKHSAGIARDLRVALGGRAVNNSTNPSKPARAYCKPKNSGSMSNTTSSSRGSSGSSGSTRGSSSRVPSSTAKPAAQYSSSAAKPPSSSSSSIPSSSKSSSASASSTSAKATSTPPASSPYKLLKAYQGNNFFNGWDFFTGADPTHGIVTFLDQNAAEDSGLAYINDQGNAVMSVETTPQVQDTRKSVRITTQATYTGGILILDAVHMPTGCGVWPAFWSNGPDWPTGGEIDILEGVNDYTNNQATIHSSPGCTLPTSTSSKLGISGNLVAGTDCSAADTGNQGCGIRAAQSNSFGAAFNNVGGGVYAMNWDDSGISIYFFPRDSIPSDITSGNPQPDNWDLPMAHWPASTCSPFQFFHDHSAIFDTTLCGDWASGVWSASGVPGQEQSCAQRTGFSTCEAFIRARGDALSEAYWEVSSVKIYQLK